MKIKGIFFDIYGTLLIYPNNAWSEWVSIFYKSFKNSGLQISEESFGKLCDGFFGKPEPAVQDDGLTVYERRIKVFSIDLGLHLDKYKIKNIAASSVDAFHKYITLDPDALPVLKALKENKILAIVSNFDHPPHIHSILSNFNIYEFFNSIVISGEVGIKKPDPRIFSYALRETYLQPNEVAYVGDAPEDVQGAQAAGIYPILIQRNNLSKDYLLTDYHLPKKSLNMIEQKLKLKSCKTISNLTELVELFL